METNRILLRPFINEDVYDVFEYLKDLKVHCFLDMRVENINEVDMSERIRHPENYFAVVQQITNLHQTTQTFVTYV